MSEQIQERTHDNELSQSFEIIDTNNLEQSNDNEPTQSISERINQRITKKLVVN